jgi:AcrR family transcriptional regulator
MNAKRTSSTVRRGSAGRPARVSRDDIVRAARRIVDEEGLARLTMRRLAGEVGTTPMALYHHVSGKDTLLVLMLEDLARTIRRPRLPSDPRQRIIAVFRHLHTAFSSFPWVMEVIGTDDLMSEEGLFYVEHIVAAAVEAGLTPRQAVDSYRALWYYTVGEITIRRSAARREEARSAPNLRDQIFAHLDPEQYPHLAALGPRWAELTARDTYRAGLEALVDGLLPTAPK